MTDPRPLSAILDAIPVETEGALRRVTEAARPRRHPERRRRVGAFIMAAAATAIVLAILVAIMPPGLRPDRLRGRLAPSGGTYRFTPLTLGAVAHVGAERTVQVSGTSSWTSETYPGEARCVVNVVDRSGARLGTAELGYSTYEPGPVAFSTEISISEGTPVSGSVRCGPGEVFVGSDYVFSDIEDNGVAVRARVGTTAGTAGDAACALTWRDDAGDTQAHPFTLSVQAGFLLTLRVRLEGAQPTIRCEPLRGPWQQEPAYWGATGGG